MSKLPINKINNLKTWKGMLSANICAFFPRFTQNALLCTHSTRQCAAGWIALLDHIVNGLRARS